MVKSAVAFGLAMGLASTAAAVTMPAPLRDNRVLTNNAADFRSDKRFEYWDTNGSATTANLADGQQAGFLASRYGLNPLQPPSAPASNSVLPQLERAVIEFRAGGATQGSSNSTYGVHTPNASSGLPESLGGAGVSRSLNSTGTGFASINASTSMVSTTGKINVPWDSFLQQNGTLQQVQPPPVMFSISRIGSTLTVKIGDQSSGSQWDHIWSATSNGFTDINGIQLRMAAGGFSAWKITDLRYNGQLLQSSIGSGPTNLYQADGLAETPFTERELFMWEKVIGDFSLTGNVFLGWTIARPTNNAASLQFKLIDLPTLEPVPEPASWAMLIAGFGLVGATLRRRRTVLA